MSKSVWVCYTELVGEFTTVCKIFSTEEQAQEWVKMSEAIDPNDTIWDPKYYSFSFFYGECVVDDDGTECCAIHETKEK